MNKNNKNFFNRFLFQIAIYQIQFWNLNNTKKEITFVINYQL